MRVQSGGQGERLRARLRFDRDGASQILAARIGSAAFLVGGLLAYIAISLTHPPNSTPDSIIAGAAVVLGLIGFVLPWSRWSARAQLAIPIGALLVLVCGSAVGNADAAPFLAVLPLLFVFIGFTQPPGTSLAFAPAAVIGLAVAHGLSAMQPLVASVVIVVPLSVLVGEAIAQSQVQRDRAHEQIGRLLHAVRVLARVNDERSGAQLVASLCAHLLHADAVAVLLADRPESGRFLNRAWFGHPALADAAPLVIDTRSEPTLSPRATRFFPDTSVTPLLHAPGAPGRIRSAALLTLPGDAGLPVGMVLAMWGTHRRTLPTTARQAAELMSEEAGRMFQRLQATAALTRDARTDPLTDLSNRRTFAHALSRLRPGDAVVIVDLDHFKSVNDRFGHDAGDDVLRALAGCLRKVAREVDCVSRYGGEEFALVLPEAGGTGALRLLNRVRSAWEALDPITTFSAGIAVHEPGEQASSTLRHADAALYQAKEAGRDRDMLAPAREIVLS